MKPLAVREKDFEPEGGTYLKKKKTAKGDCAARRKALQGKKAGDTTAKTNRERGGIRGKGLKTTGERVGRKGARGKKRNWKLNASPGKSRRERLKRGGKTLAVIVTGLCNRNPSEDSE